MHTSELKVCFRNEKKRPLAIVDSIKNINKKQCFGIPYEKGAAHHRIDQGPPGSPQVKVGDVAARPFGPKEPVGRRGRREDVDLSLASGLSEAVTGKHKGTLYAEKGEPTEGLPQRKVRQSCSALRRQEQPFVDAR